MKRILFLFLPAVLLLPACNSTVEPVEKRVEEYTIYGILNLRKDTSFIRVKDINTGLSEELSRNFEGIVRLRNLDAGTEEVLKSRQIVFEGITTHNFYPETPIEEITEYRIEVERNGRVITSANAITPSEATLSIIPGNPKCRDVMDIRFEPVLEDEVIIFYYGFEIDNQVYQIRTFLGNQQDAGTEYGFRLMPQIALREVVFRYQTALSFPPPRDCTDLREPLMYMYYIHYGPDFIQDTDLDSVFIPGDYVRFGGLYDSTFTIPIDTTG